MILFYRLFLHAEKVVRVGNVSEADNGVSFRNSHPEVFLEISQNSQENNCARVSFVIKLQV